MWNGKKKAITFSFDDGVTQDIRAIEILDKYGLKATFNLNSGAFGQRVIANDTTKRYKINAVDLKNIYKNHEVASHTLVHPLLTNMDENGIIWQVEKDREILSELCGYEVVGMAYPGGGINNDERVAEIIKNKTGIKYARTTSNTYNFDLQDNYYRFNPTTHVTTPDVYKYAEKFIDLNTDEPQLFYLWCHTYEFDIACIDWAGFEKLCKMISNCSDIYYGTNKDVLL